MGSNSDTRKREKAGIPGFAREIAILREMIVRINALAEEETNLPELRRVLDSLSSASVRLANLLNAEKNLCADSEDYSAALQFALAEMLKRFKQSRG